MSEGKPPGKSIPRLREKAGENLIPRDKLTAFFNSHLAQGAAR
jgi:hypothetical protein